MRKIFIFILGFLFVQQVLYAQTWMPLHLSIGENKFYDDGKIIRGIRLDSAYNDNGDSVLLLNYKYTGFQSLCDTNRDNGGTFSYALMGKKWVISDTLWQVFYSLYSKLYIRPQDSLKKFWFAHHENSSQVKYLGRIDSIFTDSFQGNIDTIKTIGFYYEDKRYAGYTLIISKLQGILNWSAPPGIIRKNFKPNNLPPCGVPPKVVLKVGDAIETKNEIGAPSTEYLKVIDVEIDSVANNITYTWKRSNYSISLVNGSYIWVKSPDVVVKTNSLLFDTIYSKKMEPLMDEINGFENYYYIYFCGASPTYHYGTNRFEFYSKDSCYRDYWGGAVYNGDYNTEFKDLGYNGSNTSGSSWYRSLKFLSIGNTTCGNLSRDYSGGIEKNMSNIDSDIFPNPSSNLIEIYWKMPFSGIIRLTAVDGVVISEYIVSDAKNFIIDKPKTGNGIYILQQMSKQEINYKRILFVD